jgi:organizing structure protein 2
MTWEKIMDATKNTRTRVNHGAVSIIEKVQEATGLKLRETFGQGEEVKERMEAKTNDVRGVVAQTVEEKEAVVHQKVEEVKEEIEKVEPEDKKVDEKRLI